MGVFQPLSRGWKERDVFTGQHEGNFLLNFFLPKSVKEKRVASNKHLKLPCHHMKVHMLCEWLSGWCIQWKDSRCFCQQYNEERCCGRERIERTNRGLWVTVQSWIRYYSPPVNVIKLEYSCEQQWMGFTEWQEWHKISWITKQALYHVGTILLYLKSVEALPWCLSFNVTSVTQVKFSLVM